MENLAELEKFARKNNIPVLLDDSAKFLADFVSKNKFKNILEIGTAIGYSGSIILLSSEKAFLTTIEKNPDSYDRATNTFKEVNVADRVTQILGDGLEEIKKLEQQDKKYDLIFLDGPKGQYLFYYPILLTMLTDGGCLLVDNVLFKGLVRSSEDVGHKKRAMITKLRKFLQEIESRDDLITTIHEIGDGIAEIYLKKYRD